MIKDILEKLSTSANPVAQAIQKNDCGKTIVIAFKKGMVLKEHKTETPAQLIVIKGSVTYREENHQEELSLYEEKNIPVGILHSVEAKEDSLCLLFK